jgi:hypothetical protein
MIKIQILPNGSVFFDQVEDSFYQILCSIREPVESGDPLVESRLFPQPSEDVEEGDLLDDWKSLVEPDLHDTFLAARESVAADLRSAERNLTIGDCTIANRSNYTRVAFKYHTGAAFLAPVGPYSVRAHALPRHGALMVVRGLDGEAVRMALSPSELRSMAYMMLATANWIDSRDDQFDQNRRKPGATPN